MSRRGHSELHRTMKKSLIIFVTVIVIVAAGLFYFSRDNTNIKQDTNQVADFEPNPDNATFRFFDKTITLSEGKNNEEDISTQVLEQRASGDLNADGKSDTVVLLAQSGGGSGVFIYIAAYVSGPVSYKGTNVIFIGDRVYPQSVSISNGVVTLKYLDRKPDEPFAAEPTVLVSEQFVYKNGEFVEN